MRNNGNVKTPIFLQLFQIPKFLDCKILGGSPMARTGILAHKPGRSEIISTSALSILTWTWVSINGSPLDVACVYNAKCSCPSPDNAPHSCHLLRQVLHFLRHRRPHWFHSMVSLGRWGFGFRIPTEGLRSMMLVPTLRTDNLLKTSYRVSNAGSKIWVEISAGIRSIGIKVYSIGVDPFLRKEYCV